MIISKKPTLGTSAVSIAAILMITPLISLIAVANAQEQEQDISVTEPTRQLTSQWWQWVLSIPPGDNPLLDTTGEKCQAGDMGDIFFLVGTFGGSAERDCTISEGQEILIPIINTICLDKPGGLDPAEPGNFSTPRGRPGSCQEEVVSFIDQADVSNLELTIDGVSIENLEDFRVQSNPFPTRLPEDNFFGVPSGTYPGISDGYWVVVESLPAGEHTIHFAGQAPDLTVDVTYHLTVV
jgi:hypothetical protein